MSQLEKRVMSTHSQLGIKFPDGSILGCYVHYDGGTMAPRIKDYLKKYTITSLVLLIDKAQKVGGIRSFHTADFKEDDWPIEDPHKTTQLFDDPAPYIIDETSWGSGSLAESYYYLVDYESGDIYSELPDTLSLEDCRAIVYKHQSK